MTEAEWLTSTDLLRFRQVLCGKASGRKLRLFDVACCRRVWNLLPGDAQRVIEVAELFADGRVSGESLHEAARRAKQASDPVGDPAALDDESLRTLEPVLHSGTAECLENRAFRRTLSGEWPRSERVSLKTLGFRAISGFKVHNRL